MDRQTDRTATAISCSSQLTIQYDMIEELDVDSKAV